MKLKNAVIAWNISEENSNSRKVIVKDIKDQCPNWLKGYRYCDWAVCSYWTKLNYSERRIRMFIFFVELQKLYKIPFDDLLKEFENIDEFYNVIANEGE